MFSKPRAIAGLNRPRTFALLLSLSFVLVFVPCVTAQPSYQQQQYQNYQRQQEAYRQQQQAAEQQRQRDYQQTQQLQQQQWQQMQQQQKLQQEAANRSKRYRDEEGDRRRRQQQLLNRSYEQLEYGTSPDDVEHSPVGENSQATGGTSQAEGRTEAEPGDQLAIRLLFLAAIVGVGYYVFKAGFQTPAKTHHAARKSG